jgi:hypothetical protein
MPMTMMMMMMKIKMAATMWAVLSMDDHRQHSFLRRPTYLGLKARRTTRT